MSLLNDKVNRLVQENGIISVLDALAENAGNAVRLYQNENQEWAADLWADLRGDILQARRDYEDRRNDKVEEFVANLYAT